MTKNELIQEIYEVLPTKYKMHYSRKLVQLVVDELFTAIIAATLQGEEVRIRHFASFSPRFQKPHRYYNAKHKGLVMSKPYMRVAFRASSLWRKSLRDVIEKK